MIALLRRTTLIALILAWPLGACAPVRPAEARSGPDSFAPIVRKVLPAVVNIAVTEAAPQGDDPLAGLPPALQRQFRDQMRQRRREVQGAGSGFIIDPSGYIVTNNHVVGAADRIVVALSDGQELPARVVGVDQLTDVALIKVNAPSRLPYVSFGDSKGVEVGDWVVAAGNPYGLGGTVTAGIVSARGRNIGEGPFDDFIQIDAPINPGNSGGPVFDEDGVVVGMNTAIVSPTGGSVGIGFAIPSEIVSRVVADLRHAGHVDRGWLGVNIRDTESDSGDMLSGDAGGDSGAADSGPNGGGAGVGIESVDRGGPAARAGLRAGDTVLAVNGQRVESANGLIKAIAATPPGTSVRLAVQRGGHSFELSVTVGRRPSEGAG